MSDDKQYDFEDTTEIEVADNNVGLLLKVIAAVLTLICLAYFAGLFFSGSKTTQEKEPPAPAVQQEK